MKEKQHWNHIHHLQQQLDISRLRRCQLTHIVKKKWWWCGFSYTFFIPLHTHSTHTSCNSICAIHITEKDYNRSRAMASRKKNRSNITVTIECTSFRQLTTNHTQLHTNAPNRRHTNTHWYMNISGNSVC